MKLLLLTFLGLVSLCQGAHVNLESLDPVQPLKLQPNLVLADDIEVDLNSLNFEQDSLIVEDEIMDRADPFYAADYSKLVKGVATIKGASPVPSIMALFGEKAFPVATNEKGDVTFAGSRLGDGLIFAAGRKEFFTSGDAAFVKNVVTWASAGQAAPAVASRSSEPISGYPSSTVSVPTSSLSSKDIKVYFVNAHDDITDKEVAEVIAFVNGGGGLIVAGQAWSWAQSMKSEESYADYPGNKILSKAGLLLTSYDWSTLNFPTSTMPPIQSNLFYAFQTLETSPSVKIASVAIQRVGAHVLTVSNADRPEFKEIFLKALDLMKSTKDAKVYSSIADTIVPAIAQSALVSQVTPAADVSTFPYNPPANAEKVTVTVNIDGNTSSKDKLHFIYAGIGANEWRSTGLYAPPGKLVKFKIPAESVGKIGFQIGCHTDQLYKKKEKLLRSPDIVNNINPIKEEGNLINPWGGLIYVTLPGGSTLGNFAVTLTDAIRAPYFIKGKTTKAEWMAGIKDYPAPWAEIEAPGQMVWTVPSSLVRKMDDVEEYAGFWEDEMLTAKKFGGFDDGKGVRAERYVWDIQISAGYMHSGYPMMGYISSLSDSKNKIDGRGPYMIAAESKKFGQWGPFHEIGHNFQWKRYTIDQTLQTGCNWWSIVMMGKTTENVGKGHSQLLAKSGRINDWIFKGKPFKEWSVWLALDTYSILAEKFGWESYTETIKIYYANEAADSILDNDAAILNKWVVRYSGVVKTNLCPYFKWWQFPLTAETIAKCAKLKDLDTDLLKDYRHPTTNRGDCPANWEAYGDSCFFLSTEKKAWFDAESTCQEQPNTHLASCLSLQEFAFVNKLKDTGEYYHWMGYNDLHKFNTWVNLDGSPAVTANIPWKSGKPSSDDVYHCGLNYKKEVEDWDCNRKEKFICKMGKTDTCGPSKASSSCPKGWTYFGNKCYLFSYTVVAQADAVKLCSANKAALVEINSQEESDYLVHAASSARKSSLVSYVYTGYWIGMSSNGDDAAKWSKWTSGASVSFSKWCEGEPNAKSGDNFAHLWGYHGYCWGDSYAGNKQGVICEKNPEMQ